MTSWYLSDNFADKAYTILTQKVSCSYSISIQHPALKKILKLVNRGIILVRSSQMPESCIFIKKRSLAQVFSCEFCKILKNNFLQSIFERLLLFCFMGRCFLAYNGDPSIDFFQKIYFQNKDKHFDHIKLKCNKIVSKKRYTNLT